MTSAFWRDRPTFVTGGTGLVGGWLLERLLEAGADVVCLVRDQVPRSRVRSSGALAKVTVVGGDVRDQALLERVLGEYEIDVVLHLAAQTIVGIANRNPISTFESNVQGTWALLEACRRSPAVRQIVLASSDKAYGMQGVDAYDESAPLLGRHPYDASKSCADMLGQTYANTYGLPVAITRCGNFFGGGDLNWSRIVPGTIRSLLRGERPVIRSDGKYIRDYFYVEDGAAAYMLLAQKLAEQPELRGHAFNFSNEMRVSVLELVQRIARLLESELQPDIRNEVANEIPHQCLSARKAREVLGWKPLFTLDEGLRRTVDWYRSYFGHGAVA